MKYFKLITKRSNFWLYSLHKGQLLFYNITTYYRSSVPVSVGISLGSVVVFSDWFSFFAFNLSFCSSACSGLFHAIQPSRFFRRWSLAVLNSSPIIPSRRSHVLKVYFSLDDAVTPDKGVVGALKGNENVLPRQQKRYRPELHTVRLIKYLFGTKGAQCRKARRDREHMQ